MSINSTGFDVDLDYQNDPQSSVPESGSGGDVIPLWNLSREDLLSSLAGSSFSNQSTFDIPLAFLSQGFDRDWRGNENDQGLSVRGRALDVSGLPLSGRVKISIEGSDIIDESVSGGFVYSVGVPNAIEEGSNVQGASYTFSFIPSKVGIDNVVEGISPSLDLGNFQYGEIKGKVTDFEGNPATNSSVSSDGFSTRTDSNGEYSAIAPGGKSIELTSLNGSSTISFTTSSGGSISQDFQFGGLEVILQIPDGTGIPGVTVSTDGTVGRESTGSDGKVRYNKAVVSGQINADLGEGKYKLSVTSPQQGQLSQIQKVTGFGLRGSVSDSSGEDVDSVDVSINRDSPLESSIENGELVAGDDVSGSVVLTISDSDRRFSRYDEVFDALNGEVEDGLNIVLEEKENIGTAI